MAILYFPRIDDFAATAITRDMLDKSPAELSDAARFAAAAL